ncbi:hypothetical protein SAMN05428995_10229 [Loktanella sp. DSM 29012]|uniref:Cupin domain-containing protein n=2 Tax=Loktanella TaxID=245186 RepID=A0ABS8BPT6_9RHOB|nr:cupin domain-containing protein [Loktanella gaetbuli]MCB5197734.1 cupin domain-containing protein [Loktanella gaetbuli]SEP92460.1 hypothetical protein SAMN05428995_10229 [Loktanella sp. DSM 29012]
MEGSPDRLMHMSTAQLISYLDLAPHPEGGWFRETWSHGDGPRANITAIYFLLARGESSHWHRVDTPEIWLFHAGAPLVLSRAATEAGPAEDVIMGPDLASGHIPQVALPPMEWQAARTTGNWTLCTCICAPGFEYAGFELAEPGFDIPRY